ncbi:MAG: NADH-quinone oxidoreductase subunit N, partial [Desulfuromonadales bacterium]|nr:NADH-quinone oxidoreductase subunit N [Desulfuromonadales bacterium]NIR33305.1 NADH-quinone oxidoreductase subunit N [Desulfuromonadales bacterium]NIS42084.1 NADH-quinone oxidoreductase subunit N [Desulfuromonadales bacterium]
LAKFFIFKTVIASGHLLPAVLAFAASYVGVIYYLGIVGRVFNIAVTPAGEDRGYRLCSTFGGMLLGSLVLMVLMLTPGIFHGLI